MAFHLYWLQCGRGARDERGRGSERPRVWKAQRICVGSSGVGELGVLAGSGTGVGAGSDASPRGSGLASSPIHTALTGLAGASSQQHPAAPSESWTPGRCSYSRPIMTIEPNPSNPSRTKIIAPIRPAAYSPGRLMIPDVVEDPPNLLHLHHHLQRETLLCISKCTRLRSPIAAPDR